MKDVPLTRRLCCAALAGLLAAPALGLRAAASPVRPQLGGAFRLTTHRGETLTEKDLPGRPGVLFFGFTHCPEICPTTLWEVSNDLEVLGEAAADLRIYFVTVDPGRDTPEVLADYLSVFDERIVGLSGTEEEIAQMARNYKASYRKVPTSDGGYTMEHTALLYLLDAKGAFFDTVRYQEDEEVRRARLLALVRQPA